MAHANRLPASALPPLAPEDGARALARFASTVNVGESAFVSICERLVRAGASASSLPATVESLDADETGARPQIPLRPLHWALSGGFSVRAIRACAALGFDASLFDPFTNAFAFHLAATTSGPADANAMGSALLSLGASVNARRPDTAQTPLHVVAARWISDNASDWIRFFAENGAQIDALDRFRLTPLHTAARARHPAAVRALLAHGADFRLTTPDGETPLHLAAETGSWRSAAALLRSGADWAARDARGLTALHWACGRSLETFSEEAIALIWRTATAPGAKLPASLDALRDNEGVLPSERLPFGQPLASAQARAIEDLVALRATLAETAPSASSPAAPSSANDAPAIVVSGHSAETPTSRPPRL
jgi:hypothetical protein